MRAATEYKVPIYSCKRCGEEHVGFAIGEERLSFMCRDGFEFYKNTFNKEIVWKKYN